jgi:hypothetical protein
MALLDASTSVPRDWASPSARGDPCDVLRQRKELFPRTSREFGISLAVAALVLTACQGSAGSAKSSPFTAGVASPTRTIRNATESPAGRATSGSSTVGLPQTCTAADLRLRKRGGGPAATMVGTFLELTNRGERTCALRGWPKVVLVRKSGDSDIAGQSLQLITTPPISAPPRVVLDPGDFAVVALAGSDRVPTGHKTCGPAYRYFVVQIAPHEISLRTSAMIPHWRPLRPCAAVKITPYLPASRVPIG